MLSFSVSLKRVWLYLVVSCFALVDVVTAFPDDWFTRPPTPDRINQLQKAAGTEGWMIVSERLLQGALWSYSVRQEDAAVQWYWVARWCNVLGKSQRTLGQKWVKSSEEANVTPAASDVKWVETLPDEPVVSLLTPETVAWLLRDQSFAASFFDLLEPSDCLPRVMSIVQALRQAEGRRFDAYKELAVAIALVYDVTPPSGWPHRQVGEAVLPRVLPSPVEAFAYFIDLDKSGASLHKLTTIAASELKFMVDLAAPFPELLWARQTVKWPLRDLLKSYTSVNYRMDRIVETKYDWPGSVYTLETIRKEGGICVDQAYFATQAAKARGVPSLLFGGSGVDGRHAWFGYLNTGNKWVLDAGRYASENFVTGVAIDPQSWRYLSDHELNFISEGFRRLPPYRQSRLHQVFAELYLRLNEKPLAAAAARKAVTFERRNFEAWNMLIDANDTALPAVRESLLREAAQALQRYPDLNSHFIRQLTASLRERGQTSVAEFEERALVRRGQAEGRSDLSVDHAVAQMAAAKAEARMATYRDVLKKYGLGAGIDFYDRVTRPLVVQLTSEKRLSDARQVLTQTRAAFTPATGSQFDLGLKALEDKAKLMSGQ